MDEIKLDVQVRDLIGKIESREKSNYLVVDPDYLNPTTMEPVPFNKKNGELYYYRKIEEALTIGLEKGMIPVEFTPYLIRAPKRIRGLLERDDPDRLG